MVTGGAGCIGTNLCKKLAELGAEKVIILDDLSSAYEWNIPRAKNIVFVRGSVLDDEMLKRVFKEKPEYVFHLAAHFANQNSVDNPEKDLMVNGGGNAKSIAICTFRRSEKICLFFFRMRSLWTGFKDAV